MTIIFSKITSSYIVYAALQVMQAKFAKQFPGQNIADDQLIAKTTKIISLKIVFIKSALGAHEPPD